MNTIFSYCYLALIISMGLLPRFAWSCMNDPLWQDTLRCQFYPTASQTPPPPPAQPTIDNLGAFTRVDLPDVNASNELLRCVDGTRPIIYVAEAAGQVPSNDWLITFQGGGSCQNGQACLDAYTNASEESEMGSANQPAMKNMGGIYRARKDNTFRNFNRVKIHKCGYDRYNGNAIAMNVAGTVDSDWNRNASHGEIINSPASKDFNPDVKTVKEGNTYNFDLFHQGKKHVLHALDQLLNGLSYETWAKQKGKVVSLKANLPPMHNARTILFAGHSGGASGLMHNIDSLSDYMTDWSQDHGLAFNADVRALFDAQLLPSVESEAAFVGEQDKDLYDHQTNCDQGCEAGPPLRYTYNGEDYFSSFGAGGIGFFDGPYQEWNTELDASCLAAHPTEEWRCADRFHVLYNHITTPFFVREDFRDPNGQHNNNPAGIENGGHRLFWATPELRHCSDAAATTPCLPVLSEADFRVRVEEQAERFEEDFSTRSELAVNNIPVPTVYLWLPDCASHSGAFDSQQFFNVRMVNDSKLEEITMHDFLVDFMHDVPTGGFDSRIDSDGDWRSLCE